MRHYEDTACATLGTRHARDTAVVPMLLAHWSLFVGILLITMVLVSTLLARLPLSSAMIYLALGYALGPGGIAVIAPDPMRHAGTLEAITEVALLISLFATGLKLGVPLRDRSWALPLRLAFPTMALTVALIAAIGVWSLGLSAGAAVLLGGILAPTDPVLASSLQSGHGSRPDRVRFSLAAEGGLNDGSAFPFVLLGMGLIGLHELGGGWRWSVADLLWAPAGGIAIGTALGALIGKLIVRLRTRHHTAVGLNEFLSLGLIASAYGTAQLLMASGFLAVFAAGLALRRVEEQPLAGSVSLDLAPPLAHASDHASAERATHSHHASATMTHAVLEFSEQLEKLAELAIVLIIGAMLPYATGLAGLWWFVPVLLLLLRPVAVAAGLAGNPVHPHQKAMIGWFGIRGVGSVFYLMYALHHGVSGALAQQLVTLTLITVAASILLHGISAHPAMTWYERRRSKPA